MLKIKLENINKTYGTGRTRVEALKNINLDIEEGDSIAIMGRSGSGKSTLLNVLGGLTSIDSGKYYFDNYILRNCEREMSVFRNRNIGFIVQNYALLYDRTILENVELPLKYSKIPKNKREEKVMIMLEKVGLSDLWDRYPSELSGGECQRVAIARALINDPQVLLADEPTGALDEETEKDIMTLFFKLSAEGKTLIVVTHDDIIAKQLNRVVKIRNGEIVQS